MPQLVNVRAPSTAMLTAELDERAPLATSATDVRYVGGRSGLEAYTVQVGHPGFQEVASEAIMQARLVDRFVVDGHEVRLAVGVEGVNATAALIGEWHEAMLVYGGPPPSREDVVRALSMFTFRDSPEGMMVLPRSGTGLTLFSEAVKLVVEDRGSITVLGRETGLGVVPKHAGARTAHGEVWRLQGQLPDRRGEGANTYLYLIGTTTAVAEVVFDYEPAVDDQTLLDWLGTINLTWSSS